MTGSNKSYQLDETTLYSILNLKYGASEVQIRKSYMRLARQLHPDKSKSEEAAELFKKVAHAHFILTDKKEKAKYDGKLLAKGLYDYSPRMPSSKAKQNSPFKETANKETTTAEPTNPKPRKSRPYEEQPYGFGVDSNRGPSKNIPLFKTFNAKSYQHSKKPVTPPRPKQPSENNKRATSFSYGKAENCSVPLAKNYQKEKTSSETAVRSGSRTSSSGSDSSVNVHSTTGSSEEPDVYMQNKMPRNDVNFSEHKKKFSPESPFQDPSQRHFARAKYVSGKSNRRSLSPVKNTPNSSTETLNNVRNIFNSMSDRLRHTLFGNGEHVEGEEVEDNSDLLYKDGRPFKRTKMPEKKIPTDEELEEMVKQQHEADNNDPDRQDYSSSFNLNGDNFSSVNTQDYSNTTDLPNWKEERKATRGPILEEVFEIDSENEKVEKKNENKQEDKNTLELDELEETLPTNKEPFDMRDVGDSLENYQVKRMKISSNSRRIPSRSAAGSSHAEENLQEPVNIPLPRIYKPDPISIEDFRIDLSISNIEVPEMPNSLCNVLDKTQVLDCQQKTLEFTKKMNETKGKLLQILSQRFSADEELHDKLYRAENVNRMVEAKRYDIELVTKLSELLNRQRIVCENHANLMNTMYASGLLEKSDNRNLRQNEAPRRTL
ncbi:unnamed protein product [Kluyveromyces dobzhanskii CBS 2104]|uniref:WGS project CCBQ000000000 data, contig 00016 n=1 Tax=Kluyveromyces dobzhanskii CBS 2104 TaxID=1427455 RepID=A0A0A8L2I4_9SACH|nr:unnamed protein product [Kluyveromyces dobzhanskii CBS 2104]